MKTLLVLLIACAQPIRERVIERETKEIYQPVPCLDPDNDPPKWPDEACEKDQPPGDCINTVNAKLASWAKRTRVWIKTSVLPRCSMVRP